MRFVGDDVVRVETMKVDGTKMVRTEREVDLTPQPSVAKASGEARPANAPTLRRPGEEAPDTQRDLGTNPVVPPCLERTLRLPRTRCRDISKPAAFLRLG